ncbi:LOW QUALITY PROTEIN: hypothetical protein Cgig2_024186 [Carnegiea gigantea]|uniref:Uncharacterized protein n=1 Tax=Carnegiea gigantea TaxID=171969 RepID=A0A9Q1KID7_9CARY|nr:LOW QUALITY PROTEIN: hypothetical protein Cgig2_024186 [Carnegiea gigantea]
MLVTIVEENNGVVPGARIYDQRCCAMTPSTYGSAGHANKPGRCATSSSTYGGTNLGIYLWWYELGHRAMMSSTYGGTNLGDVRHRPVPMVFTVDLSVKLWELPTKTSWVARGATSAAHHFSWVWRQLDMPWAASWPTARVGWLRPQGTRLLKAPLGEVPAQQAHISWQPWEGWPKRYALWAWRLQGGGYRGGYLAVGVSKGTPVHRDSSRKTSAAQGEVGQRFLLKGHASSRARIYDQRCSATTPSTYGGARHANKPGQCATSSNTYGGMNLGIVRRCPVPMVVRTWALCDNVQYLWWYELSTYGGTNLGDVRHRSVPMVVRAWVMCNIVQYLWCWKFTVDLSVKLWELPTKTAELGSSRSYLRWASLQLGSWTCRRLPAGQPPELVRPQGTRLLKAPLGKAPAQQAHISWQPWEGWPKKHALWAWRLQGGGYKGGYLAIGVSKGTPVHRDSSRKTSTTQGDVGQRFLLKRHASSRVSGGGPLPLPIINRRLALVFGNNAGRVFLSETHVCSEEKSV